MPFSPPSDKQQYAGPPSYNEVQHDDTSEEYGYELKDRPIIDLHFAQHEEEVSFENDESANGIDLHTISTHNIYTIYTLH